MIYESDKNKFAIIAAGEGSRIRTEGASKPKPLIEVGGIPMIRRIIDAIIDSGGESVTVIINDYFHELKEYLESFDSSIELNIVIKNTQSSLHSIFEMRNYLSDAPFFLSTTDTIFDKSEFINFVGYCRSNPNYDAILAVTDFIDDEKPLSVKLNNSWDILEFNDELNGNKYVTGGLYYFKPHLFELMGKIINSGTFRLRNFLKSMLNENLNIQAFPFKKMIDVDHLADIKLAENFINELAAENVAHHSPGIK